MVLRYFNPISCFILRSRATHHGTDNHTEFAHIELSTSTGLKMQSDGISGVESPRAIHLPLPKPKPLSLLPLIALIFFDVSGGPFGIEVAVSSGGPFLAILGFLILPLAWSIPEALVTAELATAFPENSGYVAWVTAAFGPFWGFQEGFWKWLSGVTDNAVYPVMFLTYLQALVPILESGLPRLIFLVGLNLTLTYLNYRGLHVVGNMALGMTFFTLLPFVIMSLLGLPHVKPANWVAIEWSNVQWVPFLNVMFWSLNYWDSVSTLAGEVHSPKKTLPKALYIALVLVIGSYIVPLLIGIGISKNSSEWQLGFFATLAERVGGKWLAWWIVCAAAISQIGQFEAEMSSDSFQLQGMAERGFLPSIFNVRSVYGTPTMAIIFSSMGIMTMARYVLLSPCRCFLVCLTYSLLQFQLYRYRRIAECSILHSRNIRICCLYLAEV